MNFLINTILGFLFAQLVDIFSRNKNSEASPEKFNLLFFLRDTWPKILVSLSLSVVIAVSLNYNWNDVLLLVGKEAIPVNGLVYFLIGAAPEFVLQWLKKRFGFLQPPVVKSEGESYERINS